jgi:CheY-like chemotaxis protein
VSASREDGQAVLRVRDNGIGIARDMLDRVFELFVQERQALDRTQGGLGLGLAIVQNLVQLHQGTVSVHSDGPGQGSELTVRLPLSADTAAETTPEADSTPRKTPPPGQKRVLVVDDSEDIAVMMSELLHSWGYDTRYAHDALSALALAEEFDPDVAVLDIGLPVIDGFELARRFRAHPQLGRTRLIAITGYGQDQDRKLSAEAGFSAHLVKPVDLEQLRELLA